VDGTTYIRRAASTDAAAIATMANALNVFVGLPGHVFTAERVREHAFGERPAFSIFVAERGAGPVGYAMFHPAYNSDLAVRSLSLVDLYVAEAARGRGVGRALMAAVAAEALRTGAESVEWGVHTGNVLARRFYADLGAYDTGAAIMGLDGEALRALAAEAAPP
jgi:GNAT superfamily N-acetyltransferase